MVWADAGGNTIPIYLTLLVWMTREGLTWVTSSDPTTLSIIKDPEALLRFTGFHSKDAFVYVRLPCLIEKGIKITMRKRLHG